ncbi:AraC family transcriptional regulator [Fibrisoma montanum]|uniref:AraC family transcriptional regulator n=1 Tax=Fibrisoma montanum TaxID=2305895 RepID=A0A418M6N5_9BACT|nr:AraC family transcriptional regulator [Fibrisoma montanum]RIV21524.1 AraC family transcriptional regulator [Fibrisoma montanum]
MVIKAKDGAGRYISYESKYQVETDERAGLTQKQISALNAGIPWSITELVMENVKITHALSQTDQDIVLRTEQNEPTVDLFVQLNGLSNIRRCHQANRHYQSGQCNLVYTPAYEGDLHLQGPSVSTFAVQFSPGLFRRFLDDQHGIDFLDSLAEDMDKEKAHSLAPFNPSATPAMKAILYAFLNCPFVGLTKRLFLEAKLLELLALQIEQVSATQSRPATGLRKDDVDKLITVRNWLDEHFLQPTTLLEIARSVGLNDFKLKKGFRTLFNTTVFGYLTDLRMNHARQLLLERQQTVAEVADTLGYQYVHHFSHAFRKHFGYLPSELRA